MSEDPDRNEPYEQLMERLSLGISSWNFNFGGPESSLEPESPASGEIARCNEILVPLAKSRLIPFLSALAVVFLVLVAGVKGNLWRVHRRLPEGEGKENFGPQKAPIRMAKIEAFLRDRTLEIPVVVVERGKLVSFEYREGDRSIPLLAFQTSSGDIETAVGVSWSCGSKSFHIEGTEIVCDLCSTRWDLETLRGVSGECFDHPLDRVAHTVQHGTLMIREADLQEWKPRMMTG